MSSHDLDCRNMNCPMPIVHISQKMKKMLAGDELRVLASDPAFPADVRAWARRTGHELVELNEVEPQTDCLIRKSES